MAPPFLTRHIQIHTMCKQTYRQQNQENEKVTKADSIDFILTQKCFDMKYKSVKQDKVQTHLGSIQDVKDLLNKWQIIVFMFLTEHFHVS